jgi:pimeloyl-ACP methyl ester carboxylesterase
VATQRRFTVEVPQAELDDLRDRLHRTRWPADPGNPDGRYGARAEWARDLVHHWAEVYDWRAVEARMNAIDQFVVELGEIPIHFQHVAGKGPDPVPLVLTHGWPWTFWDYHRIIGPLSDPAAHGGDPADSFDVVVPSLPGFGFSVPLRSVGVDVNRITDLWLQLMRDVLGYDRFGAVGGDFGAFVTGRIGHAYPDHVLGVYLTLPVVPSPAGFQRTPAEAYAPDEQWMLERLKEVPAIASAHTVVNRLDPQTFAYAMADSPAGLGAWLWQRRHLWCDGDGIEVFGRDDLCSLSSLYWFNSSLASSIRVYAEEFGSPPVLRHDRERVIDVPTGFGVFPKDLVLLPRSEAARLTNLQRWTVFDSGGHFAPVERPVEVVHELREFFRPLRSGR